MTSRKWIGTVLLTLIVVAILTAGGFALYRFGYSRGALAASTGEGVMFHNFEGMPFSGRRGEGFMLHDFDDMPFPGSRMGELPQMFQDRSDLPLMRLDPQIQSYGHRLPSLTSFSPFSVVLKVLFLGLMVWVFYKIIKLFSGGKSWQLSFNSQVAVEPEEEVKQKGRGKAK